jgi:hypothetical protein
MMLDLHGMRTKDAVERFIYEYNRSVQAGEDRLEVVHGYGASGVGGDIKDALAALLDAHPDKARYIKGEMLGNKGMIVVIPDEVLPSRRTSLDAVVYHALSGKPQSVYVIEEKLHGLASADEIQRSISNLLALNKVLRIIQAGRLLYTRK